MCSTVAKAIGAQAASRIEMPAGTGITITAAASDVIVLRGLALSASGGNFGIDFQTGQALSVENCIINGFTISGIQLSRSADVANPRIRIDHSVIRINNIGVFTANTGVGAPPPGFADLTITNSSLSENSGSGLRAADNTRAAVTDTVFSGNNVGVYAATATDGSAPEANLERCTISLNNFGILAGVGIGQVNHGIVRIAHNMITGNSRGVLESSDGTIMTLTTAGLVTNTIEGNGTDGTFTGTYTAK